MYLTVTVRLYSVVINCITSLSSYSACLFLAFVELRIFVDRLKFQTWFQNKRSFKISSTRRHYSISYRDVSIRKRWQKKLTFIQSTGTWFWILFTSYKCTILRRKKNHHIVIVANARCFLENVPGRNLELLRIGIRKAVSCAPVVRENRIVRGEQQQQKYYLFRKTISCAPVVRFFGFILIYLTNYFVLS